MGHHNDPSKFPIDFAITLFWCQRSSGCLLIFTLRDSAYQSWVAGLVPTTASIIASSGVLTVSLSGDNAAPTGLVLYMIVLIFSEYSILQTKYSIWRWSLLDHLPMPAKDLINNRYLASVSFAFSPQSSVGDQSGRSPLGSRLDTAEVPCL